MNKYLLCCKIFSLGKCFIKIKYLNPKCYYLYLSCNYLIFWCQRMFSDVRCRVLFVEQSKAIDTCTKILYLLFCCMFTSQNQCHVSQPHSRAGIVTVYLNFNLQFFTDFQWFWIMCQDISVTKWLPVGRMTRVCFLAEERLSLCCCIKTDPGVQPVSHTMCIGWTMVLQWTYSRKPITHSHLVQCPTKFHVCHEFL